MLKARNVHGRFWLANLVQPCWFVEGKDNKIMLLEINPQNPQLRLIQQVTEALRSGAVICYPTDSGYGMGCDLFNPKAIRRIAQIKKRPAQKPFTFLCSSLKNISEYAHVSNTAYRLMKKCLPGPYTFVLPGTKLVPKAMASKQKTVGIRVPADPICQLLLTALDNPLVNTSMPIMEGAAPLFDPYDVDLAFGKLVDLVIDGGPMWPNRSSMIDLTGDAPVILREGQGDTTLFR